MTMYEKNRKIVQEGLARRAATAKQKEAALEAVGREFRAGVNQHSKTLHDNQKATEEAQRRKEARSAAIARQKEQQAQQEAKECYTMYAICGITIGPLLLAAVALHLFNTGAISLWIMLPVATLACMYSVAALFANLSHHCEFPRLRRAMKRIRKATAKILASATIR